MKKTFVHPTKPLLTAMVQVATPDEAINIIRNSMYDGADAFGIQLESLAPEYHNEESYRKIFEHAGNKPIYVTNYRGKPVEDLMEDLLVALRAGATILDIPGDTFAEKHPLQMTEDADAIAKQMAWIDRVHDMGGEVLMSAHVMKFTAEEGVLAIAQEQIRRGADFVKIVTGAETEAEEMENLRITAMLKHKIDTPYLFLSGGHCQLHRMLGPVLGCGMGLYVHHHYNGSTKHQALLRAAKQVFSGFGY